MITKVRRIPSQSITQSFQRLIIPYTPNSQYLAISSTRCVYVRPRVRGDEDCGLRHFSGPCCCRASVSLELTSLITTLFPDVARCRLTLPLRRRFPNISFASRRQNVYLQRVTLTRRFCAIRKISVATRNRFTFLREFDTVLHFASRRTVLHKLFMCVLLNIVSSTNFD